jgi:dihydroorotate dehydrogenase
MSYRLLLQLVLQRLSPESAHVLASRTLALLGRVPGFRAALRRRLAPADPLLEVRAFGLTFPSPLGVAAGMDKDLTWCEELGALGFGFVEVGTVTALPQPGNPRPRIHRLAAERALINSMGFPNRGAAAAGRRLSRRTGRTVLAVNVGRSRAAADPGADYREAVRHIAPHAELLVLNVSSPNTPGLRDLQAVDALARLIAEVRDQLKELGATPALMIKISPDLSDAEIDAIASLASRLGIDGIVAVNTTTRREGLSGGSEAASQPGGLSGPPLAPRALEVLRRLRAHTNGEIVLISVGGVETATDVLDRIRAGATLVQAYTGFVYGGPLWPSRINRELSRLLREQGVASIQELVGSESGVTTDQVRASGGA